MDVDSLSVSAEAQTGESVGGDGADGVGALDRILFTIEKREIVSALNRANGQRTLAAKMLGISRSRLYRRMEALGVDPKHATGESPISD